MDNSPKKKNWWNPIVRAFEELGISSLKVPCPNCNQSGIIVTKWIKGPSLKPLYVLHNKRREVFRVCKLEQVHEEQIRKRVFDLKKDIKRILSKGKSFVLFSGGKDSLATLAYLKSISNGNSNDITALYVDTTAGLPENIEYVKEACSHFGVNLRIVRPTVDYFTLVKDWGIPSFGYRWCCRELKIKPIEDYLKSIEGPKVVFDGIRAAESRIRKQYIPIWYHPSFKCLSVSPIFYWANEDVISYINSDGIPKTILHSLGSSTECWCGAYKTESDYRKLYDLNREMYRKLSKVEEDNRFRYTYLYKDGTRIPLRDLEKKILKEKQVRLVNPSNLRTNVDHNLPLSRATKNTYLYENGKRVALSSLKK